MRTIIVAFVVSLIACTGLAQLAPQMQEAQAKLAAGDADGAIAILEPFLQSNPQRWGAYNILGAAYQRKGEFEKALANFEKAAQAPPLRGQAYFSIATLHAQKKNVDEALLWLEKVRDTGSFDYDLFKSEPALAEVRKDPRFVKLLPSKRDFADPFVEKTRIIHEWSGDVKSAQFGWIARRIGDVDGDKVADFTTSAPTYPVNGQPAGRVYVYSSKSGRLLWTATGKQDEQLGLGIEGAGDVNRDGVADVIAGAPGSGHTYVYSGRDGKLLLSLGDGDANELHGRHVQGVGDVDGDGHDDLLVGAPGSGAGRAYLYSGKSGAVLLELEGEASGDQFGTAVAGERGTLIVGAPGAGPKDTGRVYVYDKLERKPRFVFDADDTGGAFGGMFLSVVGDVDADGKRDIYVSDWANNAKGRSTGRIYVYSGKDGKLLRTITGETAGDGFGIGVADAGDVDRDGHDDLIVGAWQHASAANAGGKIYIYSGKTNELLRAITGRIPGETFGFDTTNLGDVDGDGAPDFLLTSAWSGINGFQSGRAYIIAGSPYPKHPAKAKE